VKRRPRTLATQGVLFPGEIDPWFFERRARGRGFSWIAGVDEAGRGPLAGPVVAAAVVLPWEAELPGVDDSKLLSAGERETCFEDILRVAVTVGTAAVSPEEIDRTDILSASLEAMRQSICQLDPPPDFLLVDGPWPVPARVAQQPITKGDRLSISVAAASIVAKVHRDRLMVSYHAQFPHYNFASNKGYGTREHLEALARFGCCPLHRRTFRGVLTEPTPIADLAVDGRARSRDAKAR
jgi:ribonuclease HII